MEGLTVCLPDLRFTRDTAQLDEKFFSDHIVREDQPGCFSSPDCSLVAEEREGELRVLTAPDYSPSYQRGLYTTSLLSSHSNSLYTVLLLDRPLLPSLAALAKMGNNQNCLKARPGRDPGSVYRQDTPTRPCSAPSQSARRRQLVKQSCTDTTGTPSPPRQISADSGIEADCEVSLFNIPARLTSYCESESWVVDQPHWRHFVTHLERTTEPVVRQIQALAASQTSSEDDILGLVGRIKLLCQDSLISFPKSASSVGRSPRYQEMLKVSVENVVLKFLHPVLWPLVQRLHKEQDRSLHRHLTLLWRRRFSVSELGVSEEWEIPLPAAVVELAALDMRSTPLDRLSALQDSLDQVSAHLREAMLETEAHSGGGLVLRYPAPQDEAALLAGVLVAARPLHLSSTLFYIKHFTFSSHPDMIKSLHTLETSVVLLERLAREARSARASSSRSARMKRELSLEELISLTDEMEQRYDRHGEVRDADMKLSTVDIFREKLARRLELSSQEMTRHQEEAWAKLDSEPSASSSSTHTRSRNFLENLQSKLICSSGSNKVH